jgi:WD40 repeat protein
MTDIRIGIDLGTCYSNIGYNDHLGMHYVQDPAAPQRTDSIPSSALLRADNSFVFGELAESEKNATPEGYQREFKRDLGSNVPYQLRDRKVSAADLTASFLEFLVELAGQKFGAKPAGAVITVPAAFNQFRRSLVEEAARHAGLAETTLIAEPVAAVIGATEHGTTAGDKTILVYDLGGGTFDTAVVRLDGSEQHVLGDRGLPEFGGTDIDALIQRDFARKAGDEFAAILAGRSADDPKLVVRAHRAQIAAQDFCRTIKHRLSSADHVSDVLNLQFDYELSRGELQDMIRLDLDRTVATCRELLASIALTPDQIDTVLLVGGGSYMPMVGEVLTRELARPVIRATYPELAVCMGAAILARTAPPPPQPRITVERDRAEPVLSKPAISQPTQLSPVLLTTITTPEAANAVAFSPGGTDLAVGCSQGIVLITDLTGREQVRIRHAWPVHEVFDVAYDPAGHRLATCGHYQSIRIWDARTGRRLRVIMTDATAFYGVAFSSDGTRLAAAGFDKIARIWNPGTGREIRKVKHEERVNRVVFSPDGGRLATASHDRTAKIWNVNTGGVLLTVTYKQDTDYVLAVAFSPDGTRLATGSRKTPAKIWDASTGRSLLQISDTAGVTRVTFSPDGTLLATASGGNTARIWDANSGRELFRATHTDQVMAVAFSQDGAMFATASDDKTVQLWQLNKP